MEQWPELPYERWRPTRDTLHMYAQVVGKLRLALSPFEPQWANVPLYLTARGLTTTPLRAGPRVGGAFRGPRPDPVPARPGAPHVRGRGGPAVLPGPLQGRRGHEAAPRGVPRQDVASQLLLGQLRPGLHALLGPAGDAAA